MWESKPITTPMDTSQLEPAKEYYQSSYSNRTWYVKVIGSLMYAMLGTRIDIPFSVSTLSRHLANPTPAHIQAAKRIFRYLRGTYTMQLVFRGPLVVLSRYSDSDWAGDLTNCRSTSGFLFNIGSGAIRLSSKR